MAAKGFFWATAHIGGGTGALDKINSNTGKIIDAENNPLETGDAAVVITSAGVWYYQYDAESTDAEETTNYTVIKPDNLLVSEAGRWIKKYHIPSWKSPSEKTISGGVAALAGQGSYKIVVESGDADDLDKLTGLEEGHQVILGAADGAKTITVKNGTYLKMQNEKDFDLNNEYDRIGFICIGSDTCVELWRVSGGD